LLRNYYLIINGLLIGSDEVLIHVVLVRVYSWIASIPASRLPPLCFTPPKGEIGDIAL
jgi:hypothetical protein